jgi:hypothetical protein
MTVCFSFCVAATVEELIGDADAYSEAELYDLLRQAARGEVDDPDVFVGSSCETCGEVPRFGCATNDKVRDERFTDLPNPGIVCPRCAIRRPVDHKFFLIRFGKS